MRILWILGELPIPADSGGRLRTLGLLRELAPRHQVTAAVLDPGKECAEGASERAVARLSRLRELCCEAAILPWRGRPGKAGLVAGAAANLFSSLPYSVAKYCGMETEEALARLAEGPFDLIQCENIGFFRYLRASRGAPRVLNTQNVEAAIWRQRARLSRNPAWRAYLSLQARRMARYEGWLLRQYDSVLAVSEWDAAVFRADYAVGRTAVVPNGVDTEYFTPGGETPEPGLVVFSGAMDYAPNDDAMKFFLREVWPQVVRQSPAARFVIVGKGPSPSLRTLAARSRNVEVTGWVEDIRPYLARAGVIVAPLRIGGGSRLKILEAMSTAKPIVTTAIGAEGLEARPGQHLLLAAQPGAFAERVLLLLKQPGVGKSLGQAARKLVEENYGWPVCARRLEEEWEKLVDRRQHTEDRGKSRARQE